MKQFIPRVLVSLDAFVLCAAKPEMGTDLWLLEMQVFFFFILPEVLIQHTYWKQTSFLCTVNARQMGGKNQTKLVCSPSNEKGK